MICFKGAPPSFSPILPHLFHNLCPFCILHNEGGNNYMWVLLLFQMETATNALTNISLCCVILLSVCSQEKS